MISIDLWKRRDAKLRLKWGISKESRNDSARPLGTSRIRDSITGEWRQIYSKYHRFGIKVLAAMVVLFYLSISVACVFAAVYLRDDHHIDLFVVSSRGRHDKNDDHGDIAIDAKIITDVINGVTIFIFYQIYEKLARYLNNLENHHTDYSCQTSLIIETFVFKFDNSFASLFYCASVFPNIYSQYDSKREVNEAVLEDVRLQLLILFSIEILQSKDTYGSTLDDMSEMVIQLGYTNLFVVCFPLTPLLALINNIIEMKVDGHTLVYDTKRPIPIKSHGMSVSIECLDLIPIISVFTIVALVTINEISKSLQPRLKYSIINHFNVVIECIRTYELCKF